MASVIFRQIESNLFMFRLASRKKSHFESLEPERNNYGAILMLTISDHFLEILYLKVFSDVENIATAWEILQRRWKCCNDFFALFRCNFSNPSVIFVHG